jgi:hypothetical protein
MLVGVTGLSSRVRYRTIASTFSTLTPKKFPKAHLSGEVVRPLSSTGLCD